MVRLKASLIVFVLSNMCYFNSTMVRLKALSVKNRFRTFPYFNSTMVRLKVIYQQYKDFRQDIFQFHYGTIKSQCRGFYAPCWDNFNSTMVRLKAADFSRTLTRRFYFNSTMVRLKDGADGKQGIQGCDFNSTMVRLKVPYLVHPSPILLISIPLWYD